MLGSDHAGEVVSAARQAEALRRRAQVTWHEIINPPQVVPLPRPEPDPTDLGEAISFVRNNRHLLTPRECRFIDSIAGIRRRLSEKQLRVLVRLVQRVEDEGF
jgi:hypothetical protein